MNPFESYLVQLLQGHILLDDSVVEVRREFLPRAYIPCITLEIVSDENIYYRRVYDEGPEKLMFKHECDINIHSWSNKEVDRESINGQVLQCYVDSLNHHYRYCSNYSDGDCTYLDDDCDAVGTALNQCPYPEENKYECLSDHHGLVFGTVDIESPFHIDEYDEHPPILHSVFRAHSDYWETVSSLGGTFNCYREDLDDIELIGDKK